MKTAVSIPDRVFLAADRVAQQLGMSRSQFYANALRDFLDKRHQANVTKRLNAVFEGDTSALDPELKTMQSRSLPPEPW